MLYFEPLEAVNSVPKVHAHLSAFSWPRVSYHAFRSGSDAASSSSCEMMLAMPSVPALPFGPVVCAAHEDGQRSGLPMNAYLISLPLIVPCVCQPQYWVQKPDVALTSADVSTKYKAFVSFGTRPPVIASETTCWICASLRAVPCE